jgi:hypothetical protein
MFRKFVLAASLAAGGLALAPNAANADVSIGVGVGPSYGYYGGYDRVYHRGWRHRPYRYGYYGGPRRWGYGRPYRPRCRTVTVRSWNGYRYVTRVRETCSPRRYYRY